MKEFYGKVAVITGAASGIGYGLAERAAQEGMKIVLADVEHDALLRAEAALAATGAAVLAVQTDVANADDIATLAEKTLSAFGAVHLLCNNAGVGAGTTTWESTLTDWKWVTGVNFWGLIYGVRTFVPIMLAQDTECHIVNTSSLTGLTSDPIPALYKVTKHATVAFSECMYHELKERNSKVKVSVLCPGFVKTRMYDMDRNRPKELQNDYTGATNDDEVDILRQAIEGGIAPQRVATEVFKAIEEEKFYILTHPEANGLVRLRMEDILMQRNPTNPFE
jgi:NAD(P)-dependent dehydrogenase (short-subunit alcohol dehydrogenase family)